jgi:hypothetical protein
MQAVLFPVCGRLKYVVTDNWRMRRRKRERKGFGGATSAASTVSFCVSRKANRWEQVGRCRCSSFCVVSGPATVTEEQVCKTGKKLVLPRSVVRGFGSGGSFTSERSWSVSGAATLGNLGRVSACPHSNEAAGAAVANKSKNQHFSRRR